MSENEREVVPGSGLFLGISLPEAEELDDKEFNIPVVEIPPTLESILTEDSVIEDNLDPFLLDEFTLSTEETGQEDSSTQQTDESIRRQTSPSPWIKEPPLPDVEQDAVLRCVTLRGVSTQIVSAADRVAAGLPTAVAVCGIIAIGTSNGLLLIFDPGQVLKLCLGSTAIGAEKGPISALAINSNCTHVLCGFANGQILQWDLETGKLLRTIANANPLGNAVVNIKFTDDPSLAVWNDSAGSVFELHFKRSLGAKAHEVHCLFSSDKGKVYCVEPLNVGEPFTGHSVAQHSLVAMVSLRKVLIITLKPDLKVVYASPVVKTDAHCIPSLAWNFLWIQESVDPVLAFCQSSCMTMFHVKCTSETLSVVKIREIKLHFEIINFKWMNTQTLLLIDSVEKLHVLDRKSGKELQLLDLPDLQLVHTCSPSKDWAVGTDATTVNKITYQSVGSHGGETILLGVKSVRTVSLRTWAERLDSLVKQERHAEALALAWKFSEGSAKAVVGLPGGKQKKKAAVAKKVADILLDYLELCLRRCPEQGKLQVMEQHFKEMIPLCATCCFKFNRIDLIFGEVYEKLNHNAVALGVLFECLEPHILSSKQNNIPPLVMKDMVGYYEEQGKVHVLDKLIPHLDIMTLDLHQIVNLSRTFKLCDSLIYVYNKGMNDYTTPIEEMTQIMSVALRSEKPDDIVSVGNTILVYISCCLTGREYPLGVVPETKVQDVKSKVFMCLTSVHSKDIDPVEDPYPFIRILLKYNTREFLNVLALTFEDLQQDKQAVEFHQRIIDILLQVMLESADFTPSQIGSLFTFLARQLAKAENSLFVNRRLFHQVLDFLCNPDDTTQHAERQQALLELLQAGGSAYFDESKLLSMAESVQFYQVCEFVFHEKRLYHRILACYLKDAARKDQVLSYIRQIAARADLTEKEKVLFQNELFCNIQELLELSPDQTSVLILRHYQDSVPIIIETLQEDSRLLFDFLHGVLNPRADPWPYKDSSLLNHKVHELYLDLLCQNHPEQALLFLKLSDSYRTEQAAEIVHKYKVYDSLAYLLESQGNTQAAFSVLFEDLKSSLNNLTQSATCAETSTESHSEESGLLSTAHTLVQNLIAFCQRASVTLDIKQRKELWFPILDFTMSPTLHLMSKPPLAFVRGIKDLTKEVLEAMTSYIPLMDILQKLMQDTVHTFNNYGEIRTLIFKMFDAYTYEKTLLETTRSLLSQDLHSSLCSLKITVSRGLTPAHKKCAVCSQPYSHGAAGSGVLVFSCGHVYHSACLQSSLREQEGWTEQWACFKCLSPNKRWTSITPGSVNQGSQCFKMDPGQIEAADCFKRTFKNPSRISVLMELTRHTSASLDSFKPEADIFRQSGIFEQPDFKLQLAPPPLIE
uniref:Vacuolar protein sorting-associated protein 8 homolog n=1 Tax=Lepisosteus oculatus TaxID=7918 RepID=W5N0F6_LEPOC|nr:PREDICTED: vacuolar protein sorting-associated protein 8 homolog [Lepisosteus oculatus]